MKSMLIIASLVAVAVAGPAQYGFMSLDMPAPAPDVDETPIAAEPDNIDKLQLINMISGNPEIKENVVIDIPARYNSAGKIAIGQMINFVATTITITGTQARMSGSVTVRGGLSMRSGALKMGSEPESIDTPESVDGTPIFSEVVAPMVVGTLN